MWMSIDGMVFDTKCELIMWLWIREMLLMREFQGEILKAMILVYVRA